MSERQTDHGAVEFVCAYLFSIQFADTEWYLSDQRLEILIALGQEKVVLPFDAVQVVDGHGIFEALRSERHFLTELEDGTHGIDG